MRVNSLIALLSLIFYIYCVNAGPSFRIQNSVISKCARNKRTCNGIRAKTYCNLGSECNKGYVYDELTNNCVLPEQCSTRPGFFAKVLYFAKTLVANQKCNKNNNEVWDGCTNCFSTCQKQAEKPFLPLFFGLAGCRCADGFILDELTNKCTVVKFAKCSFPETDINLDGTSNTILKVPNKNFRPEINKDIKNEFQDLPFNFKSAGLIEGNAPISENLKDMVNDIEPRSIGQENISNEFDDNAQAILIENPDVFKKVASGRNIDNQKYLSKTFLPSAGKYNKIERPIITINKARTRRDAYLIKPEQSVINDMKKTFTNIQKEIGTHLKEHESVIDNVRNQFVNLANEVKKSIGPNSARNKRETGKSIDVDVASSAALIKNRVQTLLDNVEKGYKKHIKLHKDLTNNIENKLSIITDRMKSTLSIKSSENGAVLRNRRAVQPQFPPVEYLRNNVVKIQDFVKDIIEKNNQNFQNAANSLKKTVNHFKENIEERCNIIIDGIKDERLKISKQFDAIRKYIETGLSNVGTAVLPNRSKRAAIRPLVNSIEENLLLNINNNLINQELAKKTKLKNNIMRIPNKRSFSEERIRKLGEFLLFPKKPVLPKDLTESGIIMQINNDTVSVN